MNSFLNKLERRFGSWAIPGLVRYLACIFFVSYIAGLFYPGAPDALDLDLEKIQAGEIWRVFTFVLAPQTLAFSPIGLLCAFFGMMLTFIFSDALEEQWGVFRTNLYVFWGYLCALTAGLLLMAFTDYKPTFAGIYLASSILYAFATYHPRFTIMLFLVIPTQIWILAALSGLLTGLTILGGGWHAVFVIACLSNYLFVAVPMRFSQARGERGSLKRRRKFQNAFTSGDEPFHHCAACGATDLSHPDNDFRVGPDGKDYCIEHLPPK